MNRSLLVRSICLVACVTFVVGLYVGGAQAEAVWLIPVPWGKLEYLGTGSY